MTTTAEPNWVEIGRIVAPQGLKGELRVYPSSDFPERFLTPGERWLQGPKESSPQPYQLLSGRFLEGKGLYIIRLAGVANRDEAENLRNYTLLVPASERPELEPGEFYVADLVGLKVIHHADGHEVGIVTDIYEAGNDLLEITLTVLPGSSKLAKAPSTVLVPFVDEIIPTVDIEAKLIEINPPAGLLPSSSG